MDILSNLRGWYFIHKREVMFAGVLFLVATTAFGLGYLTSGEGSIPPIIIEKCSGNSE